MCLGGKSGTMIMEQILRCHGGAIPGLIQYNYAGDLQNYIPPFGPVANNLQTPAGWFPVNYGSFLPPAQTIRTTLLQHSRQLALKTSITLIGQHIAVA